MNSNHLSNNLGLISYLFDIIPGICCILVGSLDLKVETSLEQSLDGSTWEPVFKCMIDQPEDDVLYDVQWFINEDVISGAESRDVAYYNMNNTSLKVGHWAGNYSLNFNVIICVFVLLINSCRCQLR